MEYEKFCDNCGAQFITNIINKKYHSTECRERAQYRRSSKGGTNKNTVYDRVCPGCKITFKTKIEHKIYHSKKCAQINGSKRWYEENKEEKYKRSIIEYNKICKSCGIEFVTTDKRKIYHSHKCGEKIWESCSVEYKKQWYDKKKPPPKPVKQKMSEEERKAKDKEHNHKNYLENREELVQKAIQRKNKRMESDPYYKARENFSKSFRKAAKVNNISKNGKSCFKYLYYTLEEYIIYAKSF